MSVATGPSACPRCPGGAGPPIRPRCAPRPTWDRALVAWRGSPASPAWRIDENRLPESDQGWSAKGRRKRDLQQVDARVLSFSLFRWKSELSSKEGFTESLSSSCSV
ncbi:hypothetical protein NPIL_179341 [Nephila pilipes]|uniref:Uncharacterized protein n=1 Tax=Nephila pilipes TaxID=299642 RepID=A0A8X6NCV6_NEPPI|nr:hypothetical protein NPIL_179341 [Nephila pilipes]